MERSLGLRLHAHGGKQVIRFEHILLDEADAPLRLLHHVTGGDCEIVAQSPLGGNGSLTLDVGDDIDWMRHRVQTVYIDGEQRWPVGTFLFTSPRERHTATGLTFDVGLLTKMNIIAEDSIDARLSLPEGEPIIPAVVELLRSTGETRIAATDSDATLRTAITFEPATSKLAIINELLEAAGYWALWCDGSGTFRVEPYVDPAKRSPVIEFQHGETSIHDAEWEHQQDHTSVPNRFITVGRGDEENPALVGIATNENPDSPYSYQARGRWITAKEDGVEGADQTVFDELAARRLRDAMHPVSRLAVTHGMVPLNPNDVVAFTPEDGVRRLATVQRMRIRFRFDTDIDAEWRQV